jgi:nicotinamidase/pyrazinamidase
MKNADLTNSVLLVIDVQNDFCPGGALAVNQGDTIVPVINTISSRFPVVVATRDWHPLGHVSFASSHEGKSVYDEVEIEGVSQVLWPDHCVQGSKGADFHPGLDLRPLNLIIHKGRSASLDSYSAFFENDHRTPTGLEGYLKSLNVSKVYVCGLAIDYCVYFSAMDAVRSGFETFVLPDAAKGVDVPEGNVDKTIRLMKNAGIGMVSL